MRGPSVRIEGIPRDYPRGGPSVAAVQAIRCTSLLRVQREEPIARAPRLVLNRLHQRSAQAHSASLPAYEQFHNLRAMRLVRRPGGVELDGPDDPFGIADNEEDRAGMRRRK